MGGVVVLCSGCLEVSVLVVVLRTGGVEYGSCNCQWSGQCRCCDM